MRLDIHIKWNNDNDEIKLPINPEDYEITGSMNNTTVDIHNLGEILLKGKRGLYSFSVSSFLPSQAYSFAKGEFKNPLTINSKFKMLYEAAETLHVVITDTDINGHFVIGDYTYGYKDKTNDLFYTLVFKEFRSEGAIDISQTMSAQKRVSKSKPKNISYTWKKGDTWQKIAKLKLGSSSKWKSLKKQNKSVIEKAKKAYKKKNPKIKKIDESKALIGYKVVIKS